MFSRTIGMEKIEGERELPTNVILIEFPDRAAAPGFFEDPAYQPLRRLRQDGAVSEFTLLPAEDLAPAAPQRSESESRSASASSQDSRNAE